MRRALLVLAALFVTAACTKPTAESAAPRSSSNVLTRSEMDQVPVENAYDAVQRLRPTFLRARSTSSGPGRYPVVFVDGIRRGSPEYLKTIPVREVAEIRYLPVQDATTRYGMNVEAGVIEVRLIGR